jgi:hypothetical protein
MNSRLSGYTETATAIESQDAKRLQNDSNFNGPKIYISKVKMNADLLV